MQTKNPRKLEQLANFFNVTTDYLLGNDTPASNPQTTTPARDLLDMLFADEPEFLAKVKNIEMSGKINKPGVLAQLTDRQKERIKDIIKNRLNLSTIPCLKPCSDMSFRKKTALVLMPQLILSSGKKPSTNKKCRCISTSSFIS